MTKGVSYCDFFFNKHSDMPVSSLCSCCTRSGLATVCVTLAWPMALQYPKPASALQLAVQGLPCHQQGNGESASDPQRHPLGPEGRMGPASLARTGAGHFCPADAGGSLWQPGPSPQNSPVCTCPLALTTLPPHPIAPDRAADAGAPSCREALLPGLGPAMPGAGA